MTESSRRARVPLVAGVPLAALAFGAILVGSIDAGGGRGRAHAADAEPARSTTTFVSINVLHGGVASGLFGDGDDLERRLPLLIEQLRALDPDVLGVQEASTGLGRGNTAARLATALGLEHVYAPALFGLTALDPVDAVIATLMNFSEGPAILSRFPITASEAYPLPRCGGVFDPRIALRADLETPAGLLAVYSTHLSWGGCQSDALAAIVGARRGALPSVVMGDFNADEEMPAITRLTGRAGFVDVFRLLHPDAPGFTVWQRHDAPERTVRRRVDYVFLVPGTRSGGRVVASRVVLDQPARAADGGTLWPSDHYGVLAEIDLGAEHGL